MSPEIVNVDEVVPEDIEFQYRGETYHLPGDIDVETTFTLQQCIAAMGYAEAEVTDAQIVRLQTTKPQSITRAERKLQISLEKQRHTTLVVEAEILKLFQVRHPELERLPFGAAGFQVVLAHVLKALGFGAFGGDEEEPPSEDPTPTPPPKAPPKSTRSRSSKT